MSTFEITQAPAQPQEQRAPGGEPAVVAFGVAKCFGKVEVLREADLVVNAGTVSWVGGPNGVGKTTLLRIIAGVIYPDTGLVEIWNLHPVRDRRRYQRHIGYLSAASAGLYARLSVRRHLEYWATIAQVPRGDRRTAVASTLEAFGLEEFEKRRVDRLSMGQRQRVRLAMTFLHDPTVVLLDEPRNSLDGAGNALLDAAVERVRSAGGAVIWCSPSAEEERMAFDARHVVENGRLVEA